MLRLAVRRSRAVSALALRSQARGRSQLRRCARNRHAGGALSSLAVLGARHLAGPEFRNDAWGKVLERRFSALPRGRFAARMIPPEPPQGVGNSHRPMIPAGPKCVFGIADNESNV